MSGAYKVTTSGYYTFEMFAYNGHYIGDFSVKVAVDTGTAVNLSTSNIPLYTGIDAVDNAGLQHGAQTVNGDGGYYEVEYNHGMAETAIALSPIYPQLKDGDGSESLTLTIGSIPAGATTFLFITKSLFYELSNNQSDTQLFSSIYLRTSSLKIKCFTPTLKDFSLFSLISLPFP